MAAVWINLVASVLCVWIVYELARIFKFSQEMALSAATLMAVMPSLVKLSYAVQRESLYLFFIGLGVLAIAKVEQRQKYLAVGWTVAGFCWSLALFTRHETLELGVMATLILCWLAASKRLSWRSAGKRFCFFWLSALVGMLIIHWEMGIPRQYYRTTLETRLYQSGFEN